MQSEMEQPVVLLHCELQVPSKFAGHPVIDIARVPMIDIHGGDAGTLKVPGLEIVSVDDMG